MKKVLIDLNIIIDFLNKRNFHQEAAQLINMCVEKKLAGFICAHEVTTLAYFLLKEKREKTKVINTITALLDIFNVISIDESILRDSLVSPIPDYEDAVIEVSSMKNNIDYIISRNISDFKLSRIPVYTPEQFFLL
ncbi:MAG TPA: PIN domain-containing protein [Termitinemataceae bacterium]|uniref:PIN domain-containing protein n=1 Tax=Treponema sp. J25 TaxID=2094121 RepID=UPI00105394D3|nr:PIN domain-containing protein [Treponema sp. J25]TCW60116.1 PIN domain nuclease [Treponema sp. J25]HOJ98088.1 PIN domain-containing protein [Termitinemataceae bacterium]HOM22335.1 PIN domain-containing protein [Termitinemataceae bacterium]HPP99243.1 PIN domain-containing protein [Termitinemataceae bacterium]